MNPFDIEIDFKITGIDEAIKTAENLNRNLNDLSKPLKEIGEFWIKRVKNGFSNGKDPYGDDWEVITQMALMSRKVNISDSTPLTDTGKMRNSNSLEVSKNGLRIANTADYSYVHQLGIGKVPERLIFPIDSRGLPADWEKFMIDNLTKHLTGNL